MPSALIPIAWQSLSSTASTITFSSISGAYRDLVCVVSAKKESSMGGNVVEISFNGDATNNYQNVEMAGSGSATQSNSLPYSGVLTAWLQVIDETTPNTIVCNILDYSTTDKHKSTLTRSSHSTYGTTAMASMWQSTSAVTSVAIKRNGGANFAAGSTFALYGVSA
jgi:hypothetical protein